MTKLIITRGLPASGKTTRALAWVNEGEKRARVNRDELRMAMYGTYWGPPVDEKAVTVAQQAAVTALLKAGKSVIVDDTNLRLRTARSWYDLAIREGVEFDVWDIDTLPGVAVERDKKRMAPNMRYVGEKVINDFAKRYPMPWPEVKPTPRQADDPPAKYVPDTSKPTAIIADLDGTLAHNVTGRPFFGKGFEKRVFEDEVDPVVLSILENAIDVMDPDIIFMSGRNEAARAETESWLLHKADFPMYSPGYHLFMRPDNDTRPDYVVKAELFDKHVRYDYNVLFALDDRDQIVKLWRGMGIKTLQVADGGF